MRDLFGQPITFPGTKAREEARNLYVLGDACAPHSPERAEFYRRGAEAQRRAETAERRQAEAAVELEEDCKRKLRKPASLNSELMKEACVVT